MTLSALYRLLADSAPFSVWQHNKTCSRTTLIFIRPLFRVNYCTDGHNGKVYISSPPGYDEDHLYVYRLLKPLYGMPSAARVWHTTMSAFLAKEGCATVGFEKSMWTVTIDGARILLGAHIDDFVIACASRQVLDGFRARPLDAFEGT